MVEGKSVLLLPEVRNHPGFDAYLWNSTEWMPLQVTVNNSKSLKQHLLDTFFEKHPKVPRKWYGVVRPSMAFRKKRFSIDRSRAISQSSSAVKPKRAKMAHAELGQYVIPFPTHQDKLNGYTTEHTNDLLQMRKDIAAGLVRLANQ